MRSVNYIRMGRILLLPVVAFLLFAGCSKIDPKIDDAAYIEIDDYTVITDPQTQGTNVQSFTNFLVTSSTRNYGYYPLPGKIPLPLDGPTYVSIRPAILVNGVKYLRVDYPMMKGCDTVLTLKRGQVLHLKPVWKYFSTANFPVVEDFEKNTGFFITNSSVTDTFTTRVDTANAYYGNKCLMMRLGSGYSTSQVQSNTGFPLPGNGRNIYVEFNYKCNIPFEVGVIGSNSPGTVTSTDQRSAGGGNPTSSWKKLYVELSAEVTPPPNYPYYFVYFYVDQNFDGSVTNPQVFLDNIKVVYIN